MTMPSIAQTAIDLASGFQSEIIAFAMAVCLHFLMFSKHRIGAGRKSAKSAAFIFAPPKSSNPASVQSYAIFTNAVVAAAPPGSDQVAVETAIVDCLPSAKGQEVAALEALLAVHCQVRGAGAELPRAVRAALASLGHKPTVRLNELLLRAFLRSRASADVLDLLRALAAPSAEALNAAAQYADRTGDAELAREVLARLQTKAVPAAAVPLLRVARAHDLGMSPLEIYAKHFSQADLSSDLPLLHAIAAEALETARDDLLAQLIAGASSPAAPSGASPPSVAWSPRAGSSRCARPRLQACTMRFWALPRTGKTCQRLSESPRMPGPRAWPTSLLTTR